MKWLFRGLAVIFVLSVGYGVLANYVPRARIAAICVPAEVLGINLRLIPLNRADWGYLKLRSGQTGLDALRDLEQHGATDKIRQTSVAVQDQWLEAGHLIPGGPFWGDTVQEKETRFSELRMPLDGKTLEQDLTPGQAIPERFWQTYRYRLQCLLPPANDKSTRSECRLSMADMNGDNQPEIILDNHVIGDLGTYIKPVARHRLVIYQIYGAERKSFKMPLCPVVLEQIDRVNFKVSQQKFDMLWVNDHAVNFFNDDCLIYENSAPTLTSGLNQAQAMAPLLTRIDLLPSSKPIPLSLAIALANRSIVLPSSMEPPFIDQTEWGAPSFQGLPPCFIAHDPDACMAMVADIDHDGRDDVIILDREIHKDVSTWRLATLLMVRQGNWTVVANHAACAEKDRNLEDSDVKLKPVIWRSIEFAGRLYLPGEPSDSCTQHFLYL
jgi:hypothetical protein